MTDLSVVIPIYNQSVSLALTLEGFVHQTAPDVSVRLLIVDDGSTEPIRQVVESFTSRLPLEYLRLERSGRAAARNRGAREVNSGLLVFCDGDRIPKPDFLQAHLQAHQNQSGSLVVGQVRDMYVPNAEQNRPLAWETFLHGKRERIPHFCKMVYRLFDEQGRTTSPVAWLAALTGNLSLPAELFHQLGGFDENFKEWGFEHFELGYRAKAAGHKFRYCSEAVNVHVAHPRASHSYVDFIRKSHAYFRSKHQAPVVDALLGFMLGEISLKQLEAVAGGLAIEEVNDSVPQYVRITNR